MSDFNVFKFVFDLYDKLGQLANAMYNFLFYEISIPGVNIPFTDIGFGGLDFSLWSLLGGALLTGVLIAVVIKALTPGA